MIMKNQKWQPQQRKKQERESTSTTASAADNMRKEISSKIETLKLKYLRLIRRGRQDHEDRNRGGEGFLESDACLSSFFELSFLNQKEGIVVVAAAVGRKF